MAGFSSDAFDDADSFDTDSFDFSDTGVTGPPVGTLMLLKVGRVVVPFLLPLAAIWSLL